MNTQTENSRTTIFEHQRNLSKNDRAKTPLNSESFIELKDNELENVSGGRLLDHQWIPI